MLSIGCTGPQVKEKPSTGKWTFDCDIRLRAKSLVVTSTQIAAFVSAVAAGCGYALLAAVAARRVSFGLSDRVSDGALLRGVGPLQAAAAVPSCRRSPPLGGPDCDLARHVRRREAQVAYHFFLTLTRFTRTRSRLSFPPAPPPWPTMSPRMTGSTSLGFTTARTFLLIRSASHAGSQHGMDLIHELPGTNGYFRVSLAFLVQPIARLKVHP